MGQAGLKAVVFDLDGTLVDSVPDIAAALNAALGEIGYSPLPVSAVTRMVGGGARLLVERGLAACGEINPDPHRLDAIYNGFHRAYEHSPAQFTTLFPGARDVLSTLRRSDIRLGICTNKPEPLTRPILNALHIADAFASIVAASPELDLKPAPAMLRKCLNELGVKAAETIMIGDSSADVGTARAAGVRVILISHGYTTMPVHDLGADCVIDHFDELLPALRRLSSAVMPL